MFKSYSLKVTDAPEALADERSTAEEDFTTAVIELREIMEYQVTSKSQ